MLNQPSAAAFRETKVINRKVYELIVSFEHSANEARNRSRAKTWAKETRNSGFYSSVRVIRNSFGYRAVYGLPKYGELTNDMQPSA